MSAVQATTAEPELLERAHEVAELNAGLRATADGTGRTVLIEAPAGLGKTRLLDALRGRATRRGIRVLSARGTELEREFTYGIVRQLLEPALASCDEQERAALLDGAAAGARRVLGQPGAVPPGTRPSDLSFSTLYSLYWLVANLSETRPLLLSVDDAHWGDAPSLQFLRFMTTRLAELPVLLAIASRPVDADAALAALDADPSTLAIRPEPLGREAVAKLLNDALGTSADPAFAAACRELTGGNPFLLVELSRNLAGEHLPPTAENVDALAELVPDTVVRSVLRRLASLPEEAGALARAVAILGDSCEPRHAAALAGLDPDAAAGTADALRSADILAAEPPFRFIHPLVGSAIHADIRAGARSREHGRAAALLDADGSPPERVAAHLMVTDPRGDRGVVETLCEAARAALDHGASEPATAYLRRALREPPPADIRLDLLELFNTAAWRAADASALARPGRDLIYELANDPDRLVRCADRLALGLIAAGRMDDGVDLLERAIASAERAGDLERAVALEAHVISFTQLSPSEARRRLGRYEGRLVEGSTAHRLASALESWSTSLGGGRACDAADLARRAFAGGDAFDTQIDSVAWPFAIGALIRADELDAADLAAESLVRTAGARGAAVQLASAWMVRGSASFRRGDLDRAEADARQAVQLARLRGFLGLAPSFEALVVDVMVERDDLDAAEHALQASGMAPDMQGGYWAWPLLFSRGKLRLAQARMREAADELLGLRNRMAKWDITSTPGVPAGAYAARALAALGEDQQALALAEEQLVDAERWGAASTRAEAKAALGVVTGGDRGVEMLREAVRLLENAPARLLHAATLTELGALLRRERHPADARDPLRRGLDLARRCGGVAVARRAALELEAAGEKVQRYTPIGIDTLTASERRVAEMASRGMTNREIAAALYVTIKTVESHLRAAYDKLGIRSRRELRSATARDMSVSDMSHTATGNRPD